MLDLKGNERTSRSRASLLRCKDKSLIDHQCSRGRECAKILLTCKVGETSHCRKFNSITKISNRRPHHTTPIAGVDDEEDDDDDEAEEVALGENDDWLKVRMGL